MIVWVEDDLTFYNLILILINKKIKIKINFYEFECVGFTYNNRYFKHKKLKLIEDHFKLNGYLCYSYGSYALLILTKLIKQNKCVPTTIDAALKNKIREAYVGGRNEYLNVPVKNYKLYSIDFNLMYFNCLKSKFLNGTIFLKKTHILNEPGFYYIKYESKNMQYPILFYKNKFNEQVYFCNGVGEGLFWYEEIILFKNEGGIIHEILFLITGTNYSSNYVPFIDYISSCNDKKTIKLLTNTLYGKLAKKDYFYETSVMDKTEFLIKNYENQIKKWVEWYDLYLCEHIEYKTYTKYTDICTAATITAKARIQLYQLLKYLTPHTTVCLLNTDEIIISSQNEPLIPNNFDVKIKHIDLIEFQQKKDLYIHKRKLKQNETTEAYLLVNDLII